MYSREDIAKTTAVTLILLIAASISLTGSVSVEAQDDTAHGGAPQLPSWETSPPSGVTPNVTVTCTAFMSFRPNPVGMGQTILVNLWLEPATHYSRYRSGFTVTFTKPDGTTEKIGPMNSYQGDTTAWFEYTVDQVGEWKVKFESAGNYFPAGYWYNGKVYPSVAAIVESGVNPDFAAFSGPAFLQSAYYQPASTGEQTLTVQADPILPWPASPLPTDYWTRPIPIESREWWVIGGHYPFAGQGGGPDWPANTNAFASNYKFTPYVQAPETAHIAWHIQGALAGIAGGQYGYRSVGSGEGTYAGTPTIIFQGRAYQSITKVFDGVSQSVWQCYDIRTGQVYWEITGITQLPTVITYNTAVASVPGAEQTGLGTGSWSLMYIGSRLIKYNPWNGQATLNISLPVTSGTFYNEPLVLSVQNLGTSVPENQRYRLIKWDTTGSSTNFTTRMLGNVSYPFSSLGTCDFESMIAVSTASITPAGAGHPLGQRIMGASLTTGALLWNVTTDDVFFSGNTGVADHGKYVVRILGGWWDCWDLSSGNLLWKSEKPAYPWGDFGAYNIASYGGLWFDMSYDGIYAFKWADGKIAWHYNPESPGYEAAFSSYPYFTNPVVADGKLYVANGEHSPTEPLMRGWNLHCINATTGEGIWNYTGGGTVGAVADGYITFDSRYDGNLYVFGKGKSATTVTAPTAAVPKGNSVLIQGTVLDQSPGQPGTPCVAEESMTGYMEFLHMQKECPATVKGVSVMLSAIKSDGTFIDIGTTTTNGFYGTFGMPWTAPDEGSYTIVASFEGDNSYGSSSGATGLLVGPATATPETPEEQVIPDYTWTIIGAAIAVIVAVAIAVLILRKR